MTSIIETERLILKKLSGDHLSEEYVGWLNDEEVNKYTFSNLKYTLNDLEKFLDNLKKSEILFWAIHIKDSGVHIGNIKIDPINSVHGYGEYGILIGDKESWGKGYAKEASIGVINYCFEQLNLRKINLHVSVQNINAIKLYYSIGFQLEGILKKHFKYRYGLDDVLLMAKINNAQL